MMMQDKLIGVLELAVMEIPDPSTQEKLAEVLALLTSAVEILNHNQRLLQNVPMPEQVPILGSRARNLCRRC